MPVSRKEHLDECKQRAREYLDSGDAKNAVASMISDLSKHAETADLVRGPVAVLALWAAARGVEESRRFIEGFN